MIVKNGLDKRALLRTLETKIAELDHAHSNLKSIQTGADQGLHVGSWSQSRGLDSRMRTRPVAASVGLRAGATTPRTAIFSSGVRLLVVFTTMKPKWYPSFASAFWVATILYFFSPDSDTVSSRAVDTRVGGLRRQEPHGLVGRDRDRHLLGRFLPFRHGTEVKEPLREVELRDDDGGNRQHHLRLTRVVRLHRDRLAQRSGRFPRSLRSLQSVPTGPAGSALLTAKLRCTLRSLRP